MSLTPGFILTDEYGDMIGLTLTEVGSVVDSYERGPAPDSTFKTPWPRLRFRWCECDAGYYMLVQHVRELNGEGDTVIVTDADIAEMRRVMEAAR